MTELKRCPVCGGDVPSNAPFGHCPTCLLDLGFGPAHADILNSEAEAARQFGDYEMLERIGHGGMGLVYKVQQISLNRTVALKLIASGEFASPSAVQRFHIEAEAAAKLNHPNIVPIFEIGAYRGQNYFSMKFVEGRSLAEEIRAGRFQIVSDTDTVGKSGARRRQAAVTQLMATVARSVHYAHQHGVLHRDLKPSNIMLDAEGQPHLTDFGLAKILEHDVGVSGSKDIIGTPSYMSPEQAARGRVTTGTDVYSLGAILYELLTGRPPFLGTTYAEIFQQLAEREPSHPCSVNPQLDRDLATICLRCLEKDPLHRYKSAGDMADDLERWLRHEPIHARRASPSVRLASWCRRRPALAGIALLLVLLSIISTVAAIQFAGLSEQRRKAALTAEAARRVAADEGRKKADLLRVAKEGILGNLNELWTRPIGLGFVDVDSETRAILDDRLVEHSATAQRIRFAVYAYYHPTNTLEKFSPILKYLETNITAWWRTQELRVDFRIYRSYGDGLAALTNGDVDFMRIGPSSYVLTQEQHPGLVLLAAQEEQVTGALFTRRDSGIDSLAGVRYQAVAFGDRESTTGNFLAKQEFLKAGLYASDLSPNSRHFRGHEDVIEAVARGAYAVGAANTNVLTDPNFRVLKIMAPEVRMPWVAASRADPQATMAIARALLALRDRSILKTLESNLTGFRKVEHREYDRLRDDMRQSLEFGEIK